MTEKQVISTEKAPRAIGPYSAAIRVGTMIFTAGQIPMDPATGEIVAGGIEAEARQALTNLKHVLEASGAGMEDVVKTTVFLANMEDFPKLNAIYAEFFTEKPPARSTVAVKTLPKGVRVEIEAIAVLPE
jgi:2-iminobutanoate/2-iminopropanoate deaminase